MHIYNLAIKGWSGVRPILVVQLPYAKTNSLRLGMTGCCPEVAFKTLIGRIFNDRKVDVKVYSLFDHTFGVEGSDEVLDTLNESLPEIHATGQKVIPKENRLEMNLFI